MASIQPITRKSHGDKRWRPFQDLKFAQRDVFAPLVLAELRRAALCLPIAFLEHETNLLVIALQGLKPGQNVFVAPDGKWIAPYIPAVYRSYPFSLPVSGDGQHVLCVDEDSGLIGTDEGEPFYGDGDEPAERLAAVLQFLKATAGNRSATHNACALLQEYELLTDWPISYQEEGKEQRVGGLLRIDEEALAKLDGDAMKRLQDTGALNLIFCQLVSMPHVATLQRLNGLQQNVFDPESDDIDELLGLGDKDVIEFGF